MALPELCGTAGCVLAWINDSQGVAAWVQGIGTVVALGLTYWTVRHQARTAKHREIAKAIGFIEWIEEVTNEAVVHFASEPAVEAPSAKVLLPMAEDNLSTFKSLLAISLADWPQPRLREAFWRFDRQFSALVSQGRKLHTPAPTGPLSAEVKRKRALEYYRLQNEMAAAGDAVIWACQRIRRDLTGQEIVFSRESFTNRLVLRLATKGQ
jgi:hypothetical protein